MSAPTLYHGSRHELPVGKTLKAKSSTSPFSKATESIVEKERPGSAPSRSRSFFLAGRPSQVDALGGSTDYVYAVAPVGKLLKVDSVWVYQINEMLQLRKIDGVKPSKEDLDNAKEWAHNYWAGKKHPNSDGFEYLASEIKVLKAKRASLDLSRIVARYKMASGSWEVLTGYDRLNSLESVWGMYQKSYQKLGMHLSSPRDLLRYEMWEVLVSDSEPTGFICWDKESFGWKVGILGSAGGADRSEVGSHFGRSIATKSGFYGEVSHAVEKITRNAPVVCAAYVSMVIGKDVQPGDDGLHYTRSIPSIGKVEKILVGQPLGVPTTDRSNPNCPTETTLMAAVNDKMADSDRWDRASHVSCQCDF